MSRGWSLAFALACAALLAAVLAAWVVEARQPWRRSLAQSSGAAQGVVEQEGLEGIERCQTCHPPPAPGDAADPHAALLASHPVQQQGCVGCHGGDGRALRPERAHATSGRRRLLPAAERAARCVQCHVPGSVDGTQAVMRGQQALLELGCLSCHRLQGARAAADQAGGYGPDLDDAGRLDPDRLRRMLRTPAQAFGASTDMPSFEGLLQAQPALETELLLVLASLRADLPRPRARAVADAPCVGCHAVRPARGLLAHRCPWIAERREVLRCARCHVEGVPAGGAAGDRCSFIDGQRSSCGLCHAPSPAAAASSPMPLDPAARSQPAAEGDDDER